MIRVHDLCKSYGKFQAVKNLSFSVNKGEIFGFLGPNGSGKTTTIRMLMGMLVPTKGSVCIDAKDARNDRIAINKVIGYLPDQPHFYDFLKAREILQFVGEMHGQSPETARDNTFMLLEEFSLADASEEYAVNFSTGMKKNLALACALINKPQLLILDEPTSGLDPRASKFIQEKLTAFRDAGGTVFLSTHLLHMAQDLCQKIGIVHNGHLVANGKIDEIRSKFKSHAHLEDLFLQLTDPSDQSTKNELD